jgi:hypothetical protein
MIVTSSFAAVSLSTCGPLCLMVVNSGTSTGAIPCTRRRKQTRASYFVAVYRFRGETPTLIFNGYLG